MIVTQLLLSFLAIFSFSIMFHSPKNQCLFCGLCGSLIWGFYLLFQFLGCQNVLCALFSTFFLTVFTRILSIQKKTPVTVYLTTGVLPLVPGTGIYYTAYYLIMNETSNAAAMGIETFKTAGAIALGIVFGFAVPVGRFWKNSR